MIGADKVHELQPWPDASAVDADMRRMPTTIPLANIEQAISKLGGFYPGGEVRRFHVGLNFLEHKHFVILSGLSGTGKTLLPLMYARAVHGLPDMEAPDPFLSVCPVRPEWTDPTGLTGYYDVLSNRYIVPPFLEAVMLAAAHAGSPVLRRTGRDELGQGRVLLLRRAVLHRDGREPATALEQRSPGRLNRNQYSGGVGNAAESLLNRHDQHRRDHKHCQRQGARPGRRHRHVGRRYRQLSGRS